MKNLKIQNKKGTLGLWFVLVSTVLALALVVSQIVPAHASSDNDDLNVSTSLETQVINYEDPDLSVAIENAKQLKKQGLVISAIYKKKAQRQGYRPVSGASLSWEKTSVYRKNDYWIVNVPLNAGLEEVSNVTYVWHANNIDIQETYAHMDNENQVHVFSWTNSTPVIDTIVINDNQTNTGYETRGLSWNKFNRCLSNKGVAWSTITVIGLVCGAVCAGTAGAGCIPCLTTASTLSGGVIGYCIGEAWS